MFISRIFLTKSGTSFKALCFLSFAVCTVLCQLPNTVQAYCKHFLNFCQINVPEAKMNFRCVIRRWVDNRGEDGRQDYGECYKFQNEVCHDTKTHWKGVGRKATDFMVLL